MEFKMDFEKIMYQATKNHQSIVTNRLLGFVLLILSLVVMYFTSQVLLNLHPKTPIFGIIWLSVLLTISLLGLIIGIGQFFRYAKAYKNSKKEEAYE
jgi:cell shape-determining protein MreD